MEHIFKQRIVTSLSVELVKKLMEHQGHKIAQIKALRGMTDMDLRESKFFIDDLWENYKPEA